MSDTALSIVTGDPLPGMRYFSTTRQGGISTGPWACLNLGLHTADNPVHVQANRQRLQVLLPSQPIWLNQVHGTDVLDADTLPDVAQNLDGAAPTADAVITTRFNQPLVIMTADCLPIVITSSDGQTLGVAHAGWRGLAAGVLENTLQALKHKAGPAVTWHAWIGPAISQPCFEVGEEVVQAFTQVDAQAVEYFIPTGLAGKWLADLSGLAYRRLVQAGVGKVQLSGLCTYTDDQRFFSYRRAALTGRLATVAWLTGSI